MSDVIGFERVIDDEYLARLTAHRSESELPSVWTPEYVGERLIEAYTTLVLTPMSTRPKADKGFWPETYDLPVAEEWGHLDIADQSEIIAAKRARILDEKENRPPEPTREDTSRMNEALSWPMEFLGDHVTGRWQGRGVIMGDAVTLWASCEALDAIRPLPRVKGEPRTRAMKALEERADEAKRLADAQALQGAELAALVKKVTAACNAELKAEPLLSIARAAKIKSKHRADFNRRRRPALESVMPDAVLTRSALAKWRKRGLEALALALRTSGRAVR